MDGAAVVEVPDALLDGGLVVYWRQLSSVEGLKTIHPPGPAGCRLRGGMMLRKFLQTPARGDFAGGMARPRGLA